MHEIARQKISVMLPKWKEMVENSCRAVDEMLSQVQVALEALAKEFDEIEALEKSTEIAQKVNLANREFLVQISHELRTPLTSIIGFANLLLKDTSRLEGTEILYLNGILANSHDLLHLVNQVADLSLIECGQVKTERTEVRVDELVQEVAEQLQSQILAKGLTIQLELPQSLLPIESDRGRLKQVLVNLMANGIKFTERGSVTVCVDIDPQTRRPLRVHVVDTGIGISEDQLAVIFEPFRQADLRTKNKYGGWGLGLYICRSFCRLMGYELGVRSELGKGSIFTIYLHKENDQEVFAGGAK